MATSLPVFAEFDTSEDASRGERWETWLESLEYLLTALDLEEIVPEQGQELSEQEKAKNKRLCKRRRALLLHYGGKDVQKQFSSLPKATQGDETDYNAAVQALTDVFKTGESTELQEFEFRSTKQDPGESLDSYVSKLRRKAKNCNFADIDKEIKSQIIQHTSSSRLRRRAIRESLDLPSIMKAGRAYEASERAAKLIEGEKMEEVHKVTHKKKHKKPFTQKKEKYCYKCGESWPHKDNCKAASHSCKKCGKEGHFEKCCLKGKPLPWKLNLKRKDKKVHQVNEEHGDCESSSDDDYAYCISTLSDKLPQVSVSIDDTRVQMIVDTGASCNVLAESDYNKLKVRPKLKKCMNKLRGFGSDTTIPIVGECQVKVEFKEKTMHTRMVIAAGNTGSILGYKTCVDLGIVTVTVNKISCEPEDIFEEFKDIFEGIGKLKNVKVKFHIDEDITPVAQKHFRQPFHLRKKIKEKIEEMEKEDLIEKVEGPTPWVSPIICVPKESGDVRICVDMRAPNQAIKRTRHVTPTLEDLINALNGASVFSKLDLNSAYHQLELDEASRSLTTFSTHIGLRRYKRLIFGANCSAEIFQDALSTVLSGLNGVMNVWDDIIVFGKTPEEHSQNLRAALSRIKEAGLTLNKKKCKFKQDSIAFFGHIFSKEGIQADPKKIDAVVKMSAPEDATAVRSFLGMTNYLSRFIPSYADLTAPLRKLTKNDTKFEWLKEQEEAFKEIKAQLINADSRVMTYFDPKKRTSVITDASPVGISAILEQEGKVICYASRSLTDVEKRYSQTEREGLAIVWACEYFNVYLYGAEFDLITDHKPLEIILNNPKSKPPARIARWSIRLAQYKYNVIYKCGKDNPADYMSRHPVGKPGKLDKRINAEDYVHLITRCSVPKTMTLDTIQEETRRDHTLQVVIKAIRSGDWIEARKDSHVDKPVFQALSKVKEKLAIVEDEDSAEKEVILRETRLVIPKTLQVQAIELAHEGHQGVVKTKQLLREKVWFKGIDTLVERMCKECILCQAATSSNAKEPLQMTELPLRKWHEVSVDHVGPFPDGKHILVIIDDHSRFPIVEVVNSTSAQTTIQQLDKYFAIFGIPSVVKTDNGPAFKSHEFTQFAKYLGFKHRKITPLWPRANGEVENFNKTLSKTIKIAAAENKNWKQEMQKFLRNYRATPHCTTKIAPATALLGENIKTRLPEIPVPEENDTMRDNDLQGKQKMKMYADKKSKPCQIVEGDAVLIKQPKTNKLSTPFNPKPCKVVSRKGSMITVKQGKHSITRNSSYFKPVIIEEEMEEESEEETEDENVETDEEEMEEQKNREENIRKEPKKLAVQKKPVQTTQRTRTSSRAKKPPSYLDDYVRNICLDTIRKIIEN